MWPNPQETADLVIFTDFLVIITKWSMQKFVIWDTFSETSNTTQNMREYGFSLTRILPYKDKIHDFALIPENTGQ